MKNFRQLAAKLRSDTRGNAIMMTALAIPTLIGGAGFAVDTAQWYMWKRELQQAVDQAAYAGAWALTEEVEDAYYIERAKQEYNANKIVVAGFASAPTIQKAPYAGGTDNSVVVIASATKSLPFSNFLTGQSATVRVVAQATFEEGATYNACLVSTTKTGTGTLVSGDAFVDASCGFAALSCDEGAIEVAGSAYVITDSLATCGTVTDDGIITNGEEGDAEKTGEELISENVKSLYDRYEDLVPPDNATPQSVRCTGAGRNRVAELSPGTYSGGLVVKCTTLLSAGIYVIDGGTLDLSANYNVTGSGIMFVLKNGASIKFGGNGNNNSINLTPPTSGQMALWGFDAQLGDMLVFEHRDNGGSHILNGNATSVIEGVIYLPSGDLTVNGTANVTSQCLKITAYTITVTGTADITTLCPSNKDTVTGTAAARVRLVA